MDTIYALSTGSGLPAAIAVVRISGPNAEDVLTRMIGHELEPRLLSYCEICDPNTGELLDRGLVAWFPAVTSYTGEPYLELHCHGSVSTVAAVLDSLSKLFRFRMAESGEFARRAFYNGRMALTEIEGLSDLMAAETKAQRILALRNSGGHLAAAAARWRDALLTISARIEAVIDFSDEEDVDARAADITGDLSRLAGEVGQALAGCETGERIRSGLSIAVLGPPNVGKSTFVNALAGRDVAIVHEQAGTTRDVIRVRLDLGGYPVEIVDTAGLREAEGAVEQEGIKRAQEAADSADLVLSLSERFGSETNPNEDDTRWMVETKADITVSAGQTGKIGDKAFRISAKTGAGMGALVAALEEYARSTLQIGEAPVATRQRQRDAIADVAGAIDAAINSLDRPEIAAENIRHGLHALAVLVGRSDVEDMLDRLFSEFCIGK